MTGYQSLTAEQERLVTEAYPLVAVVAAKQGKLPGSISQDDLESAGGTALLEAAAMYDPNTNGEWRRFARSWLNTAYKRLISDTAKRNRRRAEIEVETSDGSSPRPDPRACDPGELAAAREPLMRQKRGTGPAAVGELLPSVTEVAKAAAATRACMYEACSPDRMRRVMGKVLDLAEGGDLRAARMVMDLFKPPSTTPGVTIALNPGDVS